MAFSLDKGRLIHTRLNTWQPPAPKGSRIVVGAQRPEGQRNKQPAPIGPSPQNSLGKPSAAASKQRADSCDDVGSEQVQAQGDRRASVAGYSAADNPEMRKNPLLYADIGTVRTTEHSCVSGCSLLSFACTLFAEGHCTPHSCRLSLADFAPGPELYQSS